MTTNIEPVAVAVAEAARLCSISRSRMYELIMSGEVVSIKLGGRRLVPLDDLRNWMAAMAQRQAAERTPGDEQNVREP